MKKFYSIAIPKPCREDWNAMTPKQKGRFCDSCAKTVIDFTKMDSYEIQDFISENKNNRICGHFKQTQLDSINLHIPSQVLVKQQSFHKLFLLALLIAMGTTLMNCTNKNGNKQKIDSIEVIDSTDNKVIDILGGLPRVLEEDSVKNKICKTSTKTPLIQNFVTDGKLVIEPVGNIDIIEQPPIQIDSIQVIEPPMLEGEIEIMGDMVTNDEIVLGMITVENPPEFKNTPQNLSIQEKRDYFSNRISKIIQENFNIGQGHLGLTGKQKIFTQFKIDSLGLVKDIKVRAPHPIFEKEAKRVIQILPQFIPAKQANKTVSIVYTLPIIFHIEE